MLVKLQKEITSELKVFVCFSFTGDSTTQFHTTPPLKWMDVDMRVIFLTTKMQKCINWYLTSCWKLPELGSQFLMLTGMMAKNRSLENLRGITKFAQYLNGLYFRGIDDAFALFSLSYCLNKMRVSWQCSWDYC